MAATTAPLSLDQPRPRRRRRAVAALLLGVSVVGLGAGAFSLALFTDQATNSGTFATGSIDIATSPATVFTVNNMMPGDSSTTALTVTNGGSATLRYALTADATNPLGTALRLEIKTQGTSCAAFDGTSVLAATSLDAGAVGDPAQGAQAGDRTLAAAANEVLCFRVSLPLTTGNTLQNSNSTATFTFDAEQTANNP